MNRFMNRSGLILVLWLAFIIVYTSLRIAEQDVAAEIILDGAVIGAVSELLIQNWRRGRAEQG